MSITTYRFDELDLPTAYAVFKLRQDVFVVEQECAYGDLDGRDDETGTRHLVLRLDDAAGEVAGCVRILDLDTAPRIGRVVLARSARGQGLADELMRAALAEIGDRESVLDAQEPLAGWYGTFGYLPSGPAYLDDGIPHVPMTRSAG